MNFHDILGSMEDLFIIRQAEFQTSAELESVAFCCISTGVFRFPADLAAQIAVETVEMWLTENPDSSVKKVVFNVFGNKDLEIYKKELGQK